MNTPVDEFRHYRQEMNERILARKHLVLNRLFNLDHQAYQTHALSAKTKEMLGLAASLVLRCDDCVRYHLDRCKQEGVSEEELFDVFAVASVVGGTIIIPHLRRAVEFWEALQAS